MKNTDSIFLIGFSGSGKSTVGFHLAQALEVPFYDTDEMITTRVRIDIPQIFQRQGEPFFRRIEQQIIRKIVNACPSRKVVALGGGAFQSRLTRKAVLNAGLVVYLQCSQTALYRRLKTMSKRPLLCGAHPSTNVQPGSLRGRIKYLLQKREKYYKFADVRVSTSGKTVRRSVREIREKIASFNARD